MTIVPGREYGVNNRRFTDIKGLFSEDYRTFAQQHPLLASDCDCVYSGAEHAGDPKLPNITVVPNLRTRDGEGLFGSTMGHYHPPVANQPGGWTQEVYEFQSHGLLVLDKEDGEVELWVCQDGDKVAVPNGCHMTLYNLGDETRPLVTLDFANPDLNPSNKDLIKQHGPILLAYYDAFEAVFALNHEYINNPRHSAGVRLAHAPTAERSRQLRIGRGARLDLGRLLYEQLTGNPEAIGALARLGLKIRKADEETSVGSLSIEEGPRLHFSRPLVEATRPGADVYRHFFPNTPAAVPTAPQGEGLAAVASRAAEEKARHVRLSRLNRPLVIVVEGAGDWVGQCYRPLFLRSARGGQLSVFYADDTRWRGRPDWATEAGMKCWETYLDKADPHDAECHRTLRPDVVFVVTPDLTHCAVAGSWLGLTPLIFVEKPFDSQLENVRDLWERVGRLPAAARPAILGLDHYQFYALPIHDHLDDIEDHLGGALARVVFCMTEDRPIELGRERSLQYGLTLDMLPHMLALLTYFGDVGSVDDIRVSEAGQYEPLVARPRGVGNDRDISGTFHNETYAWVAFTFCDYSRSGYRVPCEGIVGKGFSRGAKYLEVTGLNGNAIRVDLARTPNPNPSPGYPWDGLSFLYGDETGVPPANRIHRVRDPHDPQRPLYINETRWPLERDVYDRLLSDLRNGTRDAVASTLLPTEAEEIVRALDRIWWAIQGTKDQWVRYPLGRKRVSLVGGRPAGSILDQG